LSRRLRLGFAIVAILIIGLVAAAAVFLYTADYNRYKGLFADAITDATGRQVAIKGDLTLALSMPPELTVADVTLANASWGSQPQMAHVGQLRASVRILPLLKRDIDISDIRLIDTDLLFETGADGQSNWQFSHKPKSSTGGRVRDVAVQQLDIENLAISMRSGEAGSPATQYKVDSLRLTRSSTDDSMTVALKGSSDGQSVALSGQTGPLKDLIAGVRFPVALAGDVAGATVKLDGEIGNVLKLEGLDLTVQASGTDLAALGAGVAVKLPPTGPFEFNGKLTGSAQVLALSEAQGTIAQKSIKVSVAGKIDNLIDMQGIDLSLKGSGGDLADLGSIAGKTLPPTGPFELNGKLTGSAKALALSDAQGTISKESIKVSLTGRIGDLMTQKGIRLDLNGSGKNLGELRSILSDKIPDTGPFTAAARVTGSAQTLAASNLRATIRQGDSQLAVSGEVGDLLQLTGIKLSLEATGKNFGELGPLFETQLPDLGSFSIKGQLSGSDKLLDLKSFSATVDQSDFKGWAKAEFGKQPKITARLESALIDVTRIMEQTQGKKEGEAAGESKEVKNGKKGKAGEPRQKLFSDAPLPFDALAKVDADITFSARNIKARDAALEFGQLALQLDAGHLQVEKLEATYRGAKISANLHVTAGKPSNAAVRFLVQGFDLGRFLKESHASQEFDAQMDLAADLTSQGDSPQRLMANLDGSIGAVIGKGQVPRILDLLATDLATRVIPIWGGHKESGQLNCGVIQFTNKDGIATSDAFWLDTQIGIMDGDGEINLATEQLDFFLSPKPKDPSLFSLTTKLHVTGSVLDPKVRPASGSVAKKSGKALSALVLGPAGLLTPFMKAGARNKHPCDTEALKSQIDSIYSQTTPTGQAGN
jgi:uncharacterized protein involved in outer membrane biogenesis